MFVFLTKTERQNSRLAAYIYGELKIRNIPQEKLAKRLGISQPAMCKKLRKKRFSFDDFVEIVDFFETGEEEVKRLVGIGEK